MLSHQHKVQWVLLGIGCLYGNVLVVCIWWNNNGMWVGVMEGSLLDLMVQWDNCRKILL